MATKRKKVAGRKKKFTNAQIEDALRKTSGIVAAAARQLNTSRRTIYNYINNSEKLREAYDEINETTIDIAEAELVTLMRNRTHKDQFSALRYYLNNKARARGYGDRLELASDPNAPVTINVVKASDSQD